MTEFKSLLIVHNRKRDAKRHLFSVVRDEGLTACCTSFAGFFFGSLCGRLQTVPVSNVHRTFSISVTPSRVQVPPIICHQTKTPIR